MRITALLGAGERAGRWPSRATAGGAAAAGQLGRSL